MPDPQQRYLAWISIAVAGGVGVAAIHAAAVGWMARGEIAVHSASASPAGPFEPGRVTDPSSAPSPAAIAATARARVPGSHGVDRTAGALADVDVFPDHPRLIVGGFRGPGVAVLRAACQRPEIRAQCDQIGGRHVLDDAMRYLLADDGAAAARTAGALRGWGGCTVDASDSEHADGGGMALAFDWVWETLSPGDRAAISDKLIACGAAVAEVLDGNGPHLWHGYTSLAASLALMGLAADDRPGRAGVRDAMVRHFRRSALAAYAVVGGAWPEGYAYLRSHFFSSDPPSQYVIDALRAWDSAVARDHPAHASVFETIAAEEGDWLRGLGYHIFYGTLPAYGPSGGPTLLRGGDMPTGQAAPNRQYRPFVDSIARVYGDGVLAGWGRALEARWPLVGGEGTYHPIHRYGLPYNLPLDVAPAGPGDPRLTDLPLGRIWGRADLGYAILRSGWGAGDTVVGYRAGKWFTGHQHLDQGHLDIWRRGPLALDAGVYASWGSEHREAFYMRTVAHNTLLVPRAGEVFEGHPSGAGGVNDGGQRVHTYNRRGCAQCMQSVAEWRANIGAGLHFEAGRIDAFEDGPGGAAIASDITAAYNAVGHVTPGNAPKVAAVQRDVAFARPSLLVVVDRVRTVGDADPPRFVLHLPARPALAEERVVFGDAGNGIVTSDAARFEVDNGTGGRMLGVALAPADAALTVIGGRDYRYWVDGANRAGGAAAHEGPPAEPGLWRIESGPAARTGSGDYLLVHALVITDTGRPAAWPGGWPRRVAVGVDPAAPGEAVGVAWDAAGLASGERPAGTQDRLVVRSGGVPRGVVRFVTVGVGGGSVAADGADGVRPVRVVGDGSAALDAVDAGPATTEVLLADLVPGGTYRACRLPCESVLAEAVVSLEGVWHVAVDGAGDLAVGQCPAASGAAAVWRGLCAAGGVGTPGAATATAGPTATVAASATPMATPAGPTAPSTGVPTATRPTPGDGRGWARLPWVVGGGR